MTELTVHVTRADLLRAEIIAEAARERLLADFNSAISGRPLSWQLRGIELAPRPIRRALSNPIYTEGIRD